MADNLDLQNNEQDSFLPHQAKTPSWGGVCVKLLQGPLYRSGADDENWNTLCEWFSAINDYFSKIGLVVLQNQSDGYAFLAEADDHRSRAAVSGFEEAPSDDERSTQDEGVKMPRLIKKMPLSVELSMLCVLLREALDRFEASESSKSALVISESEIRELLLPYLKSSSDQTRVLKRLDEYIAQLLRLTFLHEIIDNSSERKFEGRRIIKSRIGPEFLSEFKKRLEAQNASYSSDSGEEKK